MRDYKVLTANPCSSVSMETFNREIRDLLIRGWLPFEGPKVSGTGRGGQSSGEGEMRVIQAMALE